MARPQEFDRNKVLKKAVRVFWRKGFYDTSAQDLVDALDMSRSSIYNSFTDKKTLFMEALHTYVRDQSQSLLDLMETSEPHPNSIRLMLEHVVETSLGNACPKGCFVVNSITELGHTDPDIRKIAEANIQHVVKEFTHFITKCQQAGTVEPLASPYELALGLFHNMTAIRVTSKVITDRKFHTGNIQAIMKIFNANN